MITDRRAPNRLPATWLQIVNPIWWASDAERNPKWTWWAWFKRNPFCNFTMVILGIAHKERDCFYENSGWTYNPDGRDNFGYSMTVDNPNRKYKFKSHRGPKWEWAIGWKTSGGFTMTLRRANSPNAEDTP